MILKAAAGRPVSPSPINNGRCFSGCRLMAGSGDRPGQLVQLCRVPDIISELSGRGRSQGRWNIVRSRRTIREPNFAERTDDIASAPLSLTSRSMDRSRDAGSGSLNRDRGGILNLGSLAGFLPGPGWRRIMRPSLMSCRPAKYCQELAPRGVRVTTLCPGSVPSEFQTRAAIPELKHDMLCVSASDVAQAGYRGLMANKGAVLPGLGTG